MDGGGGGAPTVKRAPNQVCVPVLTITFPVAVPSGTTTVSKVGLAAMTLATTERLLVPANVTTSSAGFVLKLLPLRLTIVPPRPLFGFNLIVD